MVLTSGLNPGLTQSPVFFLFIGVSATDLPVLATALALRVALAPKSVWTQWKVLNH